MISGGGVISDICRPRRAPGWVAAAFFISLSLFSPYPCAGQTVVLDPDRQFQFAEHYFEKGEYYRAIGEYERFIYFFEEDDRVVLSRYRIAVSYLRGEQYEDAVKAFEQVVEKHPNTMYAYRSYLGIADAHAWLKRYDEALVTLDNLITIAPDQEIKDEAYYQCGWVYLEKGMGEDAQACFDKISPENGEKFRLKDLAKELDKKKLVKRKDPAVAGLLAILPGAGHLYCQRPRDAVVSFLANGALILAAYESFDNDLDALGGMLTFVEIGFYGGNIYSAVSSAHKYNLDEENRFLRYLKERSRVKVSMAGPGKDRSLALLCEVSF